MRASGLVVLTSALFVALGACSQRIEVLSSVADRGEAGGGGASAPIAGGAAGAGARGGTGGNAPDPDDVSTGEPDAGTPSARCGECGVAQLCAVDMCVDSAGVTAIASWMRHTCRVAAGRLYCWGENAEGQLGVGDRVGRTAPERVGTFNDWLRVATGEHHTCAIRAPGVSYCFGGNSAGQLGTGDTTTRLEPVAVAYGKLLRELACGGDSCCAIDADGALACWGDNLEGKLGQDDLFGSPDATTPLVVAAGTRFRNVSVGQGHVCAIEDSGALACWGRNTNGELGIGPEPEQTRAPMRVGGASDWVSIGASQHHTCGVRDDGSLWCWGGNGHHELGAPELDLEFAMPRQVGERLDWTQVGTGWFHTCAVERGGGLWCFGRAIEGQLALERVQPLLEPNQVTPPERWLRIALGNFHTCGVADDGGLYCWGENDEGQLGAGDDARRHAPEAVP